MLLQGFWDIEHTELGPSPRHGHTAVLLLNRIYVFAGSSAPNEGVKDFLDDLHVFHVSDKTWNQAHCECSPPRRAFHSANAIGQNRFIVFGGSSPETGSDGRPGYRNDVWLYKTDSKDGQWRGTMSAGEPPSPRAAHSTILYWPKQQEPLLVVFGGSDGFQSLQDLWLLHIDSARWESVEPRAAVPSARCYHSASLVGSRMLIFGGRGKVK